MLCLFKEFDFLGLLCFLEVPSYLEARSTWIFVINQTTLYSIPCQFYQSKAVKSNAFIVNKARIIHLITLLTLPKKT